MGLARTCHRSGSKLDLICRCYLICSIPCIFRITKIAFFANFSSRDCNQPACLLRGDVRRSGSSCNCPRSSGHRPGCPCTAATRALQIGNVLAVRSDLVPPKRAPQCLVNLPCCATTAPGEGCARSPVLGVSGRQNPGTPDHQIAESPVFESASVGILGLVQLNLLSLYP